MKKFLSYFKGHSFLWWTTLIILFIYLVVYVIALFGDSDLMFFVILLQAVPFILGLNLGFEVEKELSKSPEDSGDK